MLYLQANWEVKLSHLFSFEFASLVMPLVLGDLPTSLQIKLATFNREASHFHGLPCPSRTALCLLQVQEFFSIIFNFLYTFDPFPETQCKILTSFIIFWAGKRVSQDHHSTILEVPHARKIRGSKLLQHLLVFMVLGCFLNIPTYLRV